jgi:hypothetical protein
MSFDPRMWVPAYVDREDALAVARYRMASGETAAIREWQKHEEGWPEWPVLLTDAQTPSTERFAHDVPETCVNVSESAGVGVAKRGERGLYDPHD